MKVLQFAFFENSESEYLPYNYVNNGVVYTGTHDNDTVVGWYESLGKDDKQFTKDYLKIKNDDEVCDAMVSAAMASVADYCIIPLQDYLGLGSEARINIPSTVGANWKWRMKKGALTSEVIEKMDTMAKMYGRYNPANKPSTEKTK